MQTGPSPSQRGRGGLTSLTEINVTPFVDVMLVLLIVFMISAPLMQHGVQVDLPKANTGSIDEIPDQVVLVVDKSETITLNGNVIKKGTLTTKLAAIAQVKPETQVFVQADQATNYGFLARVIAAVKEAGLPRVGLVTEPSVSGKKL